jgi:hypothetical protein
VRLYARRQVQNVTVTSGPNAFPTSAVTFGMLSDRSATELRLRDEDKVPESSARQSPI